MIWTATLDTSLLTHYMKSASVKHLSSYPQVFLKTKFISEMYVQNLRGTGFINTVII